jgi:hypothetical protein
VDGDGWVAVEELGRCGVHDALYERHQGRPVLDGQTRLPGDGPQVVQHLAVLTLHQAVGLRRPRAGEVVTVLDAEGPRQAGEELTGEVGPTVTEEVGGDAEVGERPRTT